jgi:cellulose synthase/poly-beta-1,6-N-acetylglucosamine synthase-like glycosyltransferase
MRPNYTFTYVIGYRHKPDRLQNLRRVLDWINGFGGVEVLLIEQDKHSKISHLNLKAKHHFLKTNLPYNKSWAFNYATKIAQSDIIVFADSDLIMHPNHLIEALNQISNYDMVNPYFSLVDLNPQESGLPLEQIIQINRPGRGETDHQKVPICGGICIFKREAINKIGGWSEQYIGWGAEDDHVSVKVKHFLNWTEVKNRCYHLYHGRENPDNNLYARNLQMLNRTATLSKEEVMREAMSAATRNGMKNRFSLF